MKRKPKIGIAYAVFTKDNNGIYTQVINMRYHHIAIDKWEKGGCQPGVYTDESQHYHRSSVFEELYFEPNVPFKDNPKIIGKEMYQEGITVQSETTGRKYYMEIDTFIEIAKLGRINNGIMEGEFFLAKKSDKFRLVSTDLYELAI